MTRVCFERALEEIYAAFGKNVPVNDAVVEAIWKRIQRLPDEFMGFACAQLQDLEKLPANLGKFISQDLWWQFREAHPEKFIADAPQGCGKCCAGLRMLYSPDGLQYVTACSCCMDRALIEKCGQWDEFEIREHGLLTEMPIAPGPRYSDKARQIIRSGLHGAKQEPRESHVKYVNDLDTEWA